MSAWSWPSSCTGIAALAVAPFAVSRTVTAAAGAADFARTRVSLSELPIVALLLWKSTTLPCPIPSTTVNEPVRAVRSAMAITKPMNPAMPRATITVEPSEARRPGHRSRTLP